MDMKLNKQWVKMAVILIGSIASLVLVINKMAVAEPEVYQLGSEYLVLNGEGASTVGNYQNPIPPGPGVREIVLGYTCTSTQAIFKVLPAFAKYWEAKTGEKVRFTTGWNAVGLDSVATTVYGKPVEVQILMSGIGGKSRGFDSTKWKKSRNDIVFSYPGVLIVRQGNPKHIYTLDDLARPEVTVLTGEPFGTHGGMSIAFNLYGSILKESEEKTGQKDYEAADKFLRLVESKAIKRFSGQWLAPLFEQGIGDVMTSQEAAAHKLIKTHPDWEIVVPPYTYMVDNIAYKVSRNIPSGDEKLIDAFINFLFAPKAQEAFAKGGFRPSNPDVLAQHPEFVPTVGAFGMDYLGDPTRAKKEIVLGKCLDEENSHRTEKEKIKFRKLEPDEIPDFNDTGLPFQQALPE